MNINLYEHKLLSFLRSSPSWAASWFSLRVCIFNHHVQTLHSISEMRIIARQRGDEAISGSENPPERSHLRAVTTWSHDREVRLAGLLHQYYRHLAAWSGFLIRGKMTTTKKPNNSWSHPSACCLSCGLRGTLRFRWDIIRRRHGVGWGWWESGFIPDSGWNPWLWLLDESWSEPFLQSGQY